MKLLFAFLLVLLSIPRNSDALQVYVRSVDSTYLAGATVIVQTEQGQSVHAFFDSLTKSWVAVLFPGLHTLVVSHPLYETQVKKVEIGNHAVIESIYLAPEGAKYVLLNEKRPYRSSRDHLATFISDERRVPAVIDTAKEHGLTYVGKCGDYSGFGSSGSILFFQSSTSIQSFDTVSFGYLLKMSSHIGPVFFWDSPMEMCAIPMNMVAITFDRRVQYQSYLDAIQKLPFVRQIRSNFAPYCIIELDQSIGYNIVDLAEEWSKLPSVVNVAIECTAPIPYD